VPHLLAGSALFVVKIFFSFLGCACNPAMCVCVCACMYVLCVWGLMFSYLCVCVCVCDMHVVLSHTRVSRYAHVCGCTHYFASRNACSLATYVDAYIHMCMCVRASVPIYMYACVHANAHTHMYTHTKIHTPVCRQWSQNPCPKLTILYPSALQLLLHGLRQSIRSKDC
jgi:hypothetical protein